MLDPLMRPEVVVVFDVFFEDVAEVIFYKDQEVIQAFSADRADAPFDKCVGFGRTEGSSQKPNSEMFFQDFTEAKAVLAVSIGNQVLWYFAMPGCLQDLAVSPISGWMFSEITVKDFPGVDGKNDKDVELLESNSDYVEEVDGPNFGGMVGKEGSPPLGPIWIRTITKGPDNSQDGIFGKANSELQQFIANTLGSPEFVVRSDPQNELPDILADSDCTFSFGSGKSFPDDSVKIALPPNNGIGLHQMQGFFPVV